MGTDKQRLITLAAAASRLNLPESEVKRLCEPGGSLLLHGASYGGQYWVPEDALNRYLARPVGDAGVQP